MKNIQWLLAGVLFLLAGCNSSKVTSSWVAKNSDGRNFTKIIVIGLKEQDHNLQKNMEEHLAGDLKKLGYLTATSLNEFGPKFFDSLSEKEVLAKLIQTDADAVVTIILLDKKIEKEFVPLNNKFENNNYNENNFWNYYGSIKNHVFEPGYYVDNTEYFWESNFYDVKNQSLLYSVQTKSFNPNNSESLAHEYGLMIVKNMLSKKIVKKQEIKNKLKAF